MGQGTASVDPQQLEAEIASLREELSALIGELDHRRHELLDVRLQLRRHAWSIALAGLGFSTAIVGLGWLSRKRGQRRQTPMSRASRLRGSVGRMIERPERVAAARTVVSRVLAVAASAAMATLAKTAVEAIVRQVVNWDSAPTIRRERSDGHRRQARAA